MSIAINVFLSSLCFNNNTWSKAWYSFIFMKSKVCKITKKNCWYYSTCLLSWVYTFGFRTHLPHCIAIFYKLPWFCSTKVIYEKSQRNAENACGNRMCKRAFSSAKERIIHLWLHSQNPCDEGWGEAPRSVYLPHHHWRAWNRSSTYSLCVDF